MADTNYDGIEYLLNHLKSVQADAEENGYGDTGQTAEDATDAATAAAENEAAAKTSAENAAEYESAVATSAENAELSSKMATGETIVESGAAVAYAGSNVAQSEMEEALASLAAVDELLDGKAIIFYDPDDLGVYAYAPD